MQPQTPIARTALSEPTGTPAKKAFVFAAYAWAIAAPLWLAAAAVAAFTDWASWPLLLAAAAGGILLSAPASMATRIAASRLGAGAAAILVPLGFAGLWFACCRLPFGATGTARTVAEVAIAALLFAANDLIKRKRNRAREATVVRRFANPRVLASDDFLDSYLIVDAIEKTAEAPEMSPAARARLGWLKQQITAAADPSIRQPQPLPRAVGHALRELELRLAALGESCDFQADAARFPADRFIEPVLLAHWVGFALHYCAHLNREKAVLTLTYQTGETDILHLRTSLRRDEHWFKLAPNSAADIAKLQLVETLNRLARSEPFAVLQDAQGFLCFSLGVKKHTEPQSDWPQIEKELPANAVLLSDCPKSLGINRVYQIGDRICKIGRITLDTNKPLTLEDEYHVLRRLDGLAGTPQQPEVKIGNGYRMLLYTRIEGVRLGDYLRQHSGQRRVWFRCIAALTQLLDQIHERGVIHCDITLENVLVAPDGSVSLIDFDRAAIAGLKADRAVDVHARPTDGIHACRALARDLIPELGLREEYARLAPELRDIWKAAGITNANSPGEDIAYYAWNFGDLELRGERPWRQRWELIHPILKPFLTGARVLDLGCNMGMLSTHCALFGAARVTSVDHEGPIVAAAKRLAAVAGVELDAHVGDLNKPEFVAELAAQPYDLAIALSVVYWLQNKDAVLKLLASTPRVLFEGHLPPDEEVKMLHGLGFRDVKIVGYSERLRGLYFASNA